jgi:Gpi18-like mannosyltransferase
MNKYKNLVQDGLLFAIKMWLFSRVILLISMLMIAPLLKTPFHGITGTLRWSLFSIWDAIFYKNIAVSGYEYMNDGYGHSVAFFPLFPLLIRAIMYTGLSVEVAGILVNNSAFLIGVIILYIWTSECYGDSVARWTTTVLTCFPMSLFCTVVYAEGLYILFSTAALRAFDRQQYGWLALWGAIATAARPTGISLIPAFFLAAWRERRGIKAYLASLATSGGLLLYSLYCQVKFGDPLAFIHAQKGWRPSLGFDWKGWSTMFWEITIGPINQKAGYIKDPLYLLLFISIIIAFTLLWIFRQRLGYSLVDYGSFSLILFLWLLAGDPLINTVSVLGGAYLLWYLRNQLTSITLTYGFCFLGLILASGGTWSLSRIIYGVVSFSVALGLLLSRHPRWGYATICFFTLLMVTISLRFAQGFWVG